MPCVCAPSEQDTEDLCWWQPYSYAAVDLEGQPVTRQRAWLPCAVAVTSDPEGWTVAVQVGAALLCLRGLLANYLLVV